MTTESKHTPTPWKYHYDGHDYLINPPSAEYPQIGHVHGSEFMDKENAAHIVKCVNAHDGLVEALKAIAARINGEFDNPALLKHGPLDQDMHVDIGEIIHAAIKAAGE